MSVQSEAPGLVVQASPTTLEEMLADERYNKGRDMINNDDFEGAINHFELLLKTTIEATDESSAATAPVYYQYGASLFLKAESAQSVFAEGVADGAEGDGEEGEGEQDGDDEEEGSDNGDAAVESAVRDTVEANAAVVEELEIAWEVQS